MLSLALIVTVIGNMVLWSHQMNQLDMEKIQENVSLTNVTQTSGTCFEIKNSGPLTSHVVAVWVINSTMHSRYTMDLFLNSGEKVLYNRTDIALPSDCTLIKIVTERGNIAIFSNET